MSLWFSGNKSLPDRPPYAGFSGMVVRIVVVSTVINDVINDELNMHP
jgi:hypothetical protein